MQFKYYFFMTIVVIILYGCQSESLRTEATVTPTEIPTLLSPTATKSTPSEEWVLWSGSAHANTYGLGKDSNAFCAKCHSPLNWNPQVQIRNAPIVSLGEWKNIGCEICHETSGESVFGSIAWWDQAVGRYEPIANNTELCNQCHSENEMLSHPISFNSSAHSSFECVDCHDPHSTTASCSATGCHENVRVQSALPPSTPTGGQHPNNGSAFCGGPSCHPAATQVALSNPTIHGAKHAVVSCAACHDASGMQVGPSEELGAWVTFRTMDIDGVLTTTQYASHDLQIEVDCARCHFEGNSWGLPTVAGNEFGN